MYDIHAMLSSKGREGEEKTACKAFYERIPLHHNVDIYILFFL
jgi:hypothetical protein